MWKEMTRDFAVLGCLLLRHREGESKQPGSPEKPPKIPGQVSGACVPGVFGRGQTPERLHIKHACRPHATQTKNLLIEQCMAQTRP